MVSRLDGMIENYQNLRFGMILKRPGDKQRTRFRAKRTRYLLTLLILITILATPWGIVLLRLNQGPLEPTPTASATPTITATATITLTPYLTRTATITPDDYAYTDSNPNAHADINTDTHQQPTVTLSPALLKPQRETLPPNRTANFRRNALRTTNEGNKALMTLDLLSHLKQMLSTRASAYEDPIEHYCRGLAPAHR